jgi:hypothetical protein
VALPVLCLIMAWGLGLKNWGLDLVIVLLVMLGILFLFIVSYFITGGVFADVISFDALTQTL